MGDRRYLAFDIEIAKVIEDEVSDLMAHRPFGITCAATLLSDGESRVFHGHGAAGEISAQMTPAELEGLIDYLVQKQNQGFSLLTWNGLKFDFDVLAEESGAHEKCQQLAADHVDMMFHFFCLRGFMISLDATARGMEVGGKPEGVSGKDAPRLWAAGEHQTVLDYVANDVQLTLDVGQAVEERKQLCWITRQGRKSYQDLRQGWLTVREANRLPLPDTSWMTRPPFQRYEFTDWIKGVL